MFSKYYLGDELKNSGVGGTCNMHMEVRNAYILFGRLAGKGRYVSTSYFECEIDRRMYGVFLLPNLLTDWSNETERKRPFGGHKSRRG